MLKRSLFRIGGSALVGAALVASTLTTPATALAPENLFTADAAPTWQANGTVWAMASAQGKVFAGGGFTTVRAPGTAELDASTLNRSSMVVLDAATGVPTDCLVEVGLGTANGSVRSVAASPDGSTIYLGGSFSRVNNVSRSNVAAVDAATCAVLPFNPGASSFVYAITATDTKVYFGGTFTTFGKGAARARLAATTPAGDLLDWAPTAEDAILGLAVDPTNGNVVLGGRMDLVNGQDSHDLAVVDGVNGALVRAYPAPFFPYSPGDGQRQGNTAIKTVTADATGFYIGAEGTGFQLFDGRAAFNWGTYDQRWRDTCLGATQALAVHRGVLFSGHHMHDCETEGLFEDGVRRHLSAQTTDGEDFLPWWPNSNGGKGEALGPRAVTVAQSGAAHYLWYGGEFTTINGKPQQSLTRFAESPDTGAPVTPKTPNLTSDSAGQVQVMIRTTDDTDDAKLTYELYRGTGTTPIATLSASSQFYDHPQLRFTDTGLPAGSSQSYRVRAFDGTTYSSYSAARSITVAGSANAYANQVVADGATEYFRMEEASGNAAGSNGSSTLGGTYVNSSTRAGQAGALVKYPGTSALFDGTSSFLRTDTRKTLSAGYSVELWFNTTSTAGGRLIGYGNKAFINGTPGTSPNSTKIDRNVYLGPDGKLVFGALSTNGIASVASTAAYNDGRWHHVVATHGGSGMTLYADGVKIGSNGTASSPSPSGYWRVGGDGMPGTWPNEPTTGFFAGNIDEAAVYPTVLTAAQVTNHHTLSGAPPAPTPTPTPTPETAPLTATADSYAASATPTTNFGTATSLAADGSPATNSYLKFALPAAPAGKTLTGAKLQVRTTSSTSAGSPGAYTVALSGTGWTEGALTYNNRPATSTSLGSLTASAANTTYTSTLSVAALKPLLGAPEASMVISSTSTDGITLLTRENTTASSRPQLLLTFSPTTTSTATTVPTTATADSYAASATPTTNFGTATSLAADGSPATNSYLKFALPAAPAGKTLTGAKLQVRTTSSTSAGSPGAYTVALSGTNWTEGALTYNNRPATSTSLGSLTASAANTTYTSTLSVAALKPLLGAPEASMVISSTSTDGITLLTRENTTASSRPQLLLTFSSETTTNTTTTTTTTDETPPATPTTVPTTATADSYAASAASTTNYGKATSLLADGSPATNSYLRFTLPAAPAGKTLTGAKLQVRTTSSTSAGSPAAYTVALSGTGWTEGGLTYSNRPATGTALGSLKASAANTTYTSTLSVSALKPLLGTQTSMVLSSTSGDGISLLTRENTTASSRPQLLLTFSSEATTTNTTTTDETPPATPTTVPTTATADSYAASAASTTNYGKATSLLADGSPATNSYLRFTLPAAPAGKTLTGAKLQVRTTSSTSAGSPAAYTVALSGTGWTEGGLTYSNRPATGTALGSLKASAANTIYTSTLSVSALKPLLGTQTSMVLSSTSGDGISLLTRENTTASSRPQLLLTFS